MTKKAVKNPATDDPARNLATAYTSNDGMNICAIHTRKSIPNANMRVFFLPNLKKSNVMGLPTVGMFMKKVAPMISDNPPSWHGPDCPPVVVIVGDRTVRTVLLL